MHVTIINGVSALCYSFLTIMLTSSLPSENMTDTFICGSSTRFAFDPLIVSCNLSLHNNTFK